MKLGYVLLYVERVTATVEFYERAFGMKRGFVDDSQRYAEMISGETKLGFVARELAEQSAPFELVTPARPAPGVEIALTTSDVEAAFQRAVEAGAAPVLKPTRKPWGQLVSYVRDVNGFLVEIYSPVGE